MAEEALPGQSPPIPPVLQPVIDIWRLAPTATRNGIYWFWGRVRNRPDVALRSVGILGSQNGGLIWVPAMQWATLKMVAAEFVVPYNVYIHQSNGTHYRSWRVSDGIKYQVAEDAQLGALVHIPIQEFKLVEPLQQREG